MAALDAGFLNIVALSLSKSKLRSYKNRKEETEAKIIFILTRASERWIINIWDSFVTDMSSVVNAKSEHSLGRSTRHYFYTFCVIISLHKAPKLLQPENSGIIGLTHLLLLRRRPVCQLNKVIRTFGISTMERAALGEDFQEREEISKECTKCLKPKSKGETNTVPQSCWNLNIGKLPILPTYESCRTIFVWAQHVGGMRSSIVSIIYYVSTESFYMSCDVR